MRRPRSFLNTILGVVIGAAACGEAPSSPGAPGQQQTQALPDLSRFKTYARTQAMTGDGSAGTAVAGSGQPLACPGLKKAKAEKDIGALGGTLEV